MLLSIHVAVRRVVAFVVFLATALGAAAQITLPTATFGAPYSYQVTAQPPPAAGSIYSASGLPAGLAINIASGLISGTPTTPGVATGIISVTSGGTTNSVGYSLTVNQAPAFTSLPTATLVEGIAGSFTVTASGFPAPTLAVSGAGLPAWATLNLNTGVISGTPPNTIGSPYSFTLVVSNGVGLPVTQAFVLTILSGSSGPVITLQPRDYVQVVGGNATFTAAAAGAPAPSYQWQRQPAGTTGFSNVSSGSIYLSTTSAALAIAGVTAGMNGDQFRLVASNPSGTVASGSATLTVTGGDLIANHPVNQTVVSGQTATFSVTANGSGPLFYQWRRNGTFIPGATNSSFTIAAAKRADADIYDVQVSTSALVATSNPARLSVAPSSYPTYVAPDPAWDLRPEVDGATISALLPLADGRTYIAGTVTSVDGQRRMGVFRLAADSTLDPTFVPAEIDGPVTALAAQADGRLLVGGSFLRVDGFSRPRLARLNATGSFDPSFNAGGVGPSSTVNSILVQDDGKVVITGLFTTYNALAASGVARLTAEGALDFTVASPPLSLSGSGLSLAPLSGGRIAIGGNFTAVNGTSRASVVVVGPDLAVDPTFNAGSTYSGNVNIVIPQSDGRLVVGGTFSSINGVARSRLARLNSDGTVDSAFNPGATFNGTVSSVSLAPGGKVVVGGWFTPGNTTTSTGTVVRLNSDGSLDSSFTASSLNNNVNAVQVGGDGRVMVGGNFTLSGSTTRRGLARVNSDGSLDFGFAPVLWSGGTIAAFALLPDGKMLLARSFQYLRGAPVNGRLVRVNADGSLDPTFNPGGTGASSVVNAIVRQPDGRILIAGSFTSYNGTPISRVARLNADGTLDSSFVPAAPDNGVFALALLPGGRIVIGGAFQTVDGIPRPWLAGLTPTGAYDASFDPGAMNGNVNTVVAQPDGKVLVGGAFLTIGGGSSPRLARLTASGALDPFFNVGSGPSGSITAVELLPDGWILIGGSFSTYNGVSRTAVARLESTGALDTSFVSAVVGLGGCLLRQEDGRVLVRGSFTSIDGLPTTATLVRLTASGALDPTFVATGFSLMNFTPSSMLMRDDGKLFVPTNASVGFAATRAVAPPSITTPPANQSVVVGATVVLSAGVAGGAPALYQWLRNDVPVPGPNFPTLTLDRVTAAQSGTYVLKVSNELGSATSAPAVMSVAPLTIAPIASRSVGLGGLTIFSAVTNLPSPVTYLWKRNDTVLPGATGSTLAISPVAVADAGAYTVTASGSAGVVTSLPATLTVLPNPIAYSARQFVGPAGVPAFFSIDGPTAKRVLLRVLGPGLTGLAGGAALADPVLTLSDAQGRVVATNDNWGDGSAANLGPVLLQVGASPLTAGSKDAAIYATLPPGGYTARVSGVGATPGVALLELFDADLNPGSRLAYVGLRGRVDATAGSMTGGLTITNSAGKRLLIRAVGPALGDAQAHPNPQLQVIDGAATVAQNDNWGGTAALREVSGLAGAFALPDASTDAAVFLDQRIGAGVYTAVVPTGTSAGDTLLEFYDLTMAGGSSLAPLVVVPPSSQTVAAGSAVNLRAAVVGSGALAWQWRRNGAAIAGATRATLALPSVQAADAGNYDLVSGNGVGTAISAPAVVTIGTTATHALVGVGYTAGGTLTVTNTLSFTQAVSSLGWEVTLPPGWSFAGAAGRVGDIRPGVGETGPLGFVWSVLPPSPVVFSYTLNVPAGETGIRSLRATAIVRDLDGGRADLVVAPEPLVVGPIATHSADTDQDFRLTLVELTRVIELYNTRNGTSRTGAYAVATTATEDGFAADTARAPGVGAGLGRYHSADTQGATAGSLRDGTINLGELTRVIQLYNTRSGTTRTGQYHVQAGTEDGFAPGP